MIKTVLTGEALTQALARHEQRQHRWLNDPVRIQRVGRDPGKRRMAKADLRVATPSPTRLA